MRKHYFCSNEATNLLDIAILAFAVGIFARVDTGLSRAR